MGKALTDGGEVRVNQFSYLKGGGGEGEKKESRRWVAQATQMAYLGQLAGVVALQVL